MKIRAKYSVNPDGTIEVNLYVLENQDYPTNKVFRFRSIAGTEIKPVLLGSSCREIQNRSLPSPETAQTWVAEVIIDLRDELREWREIQAPDTQIFEI